MFGPEIYMVEKALNVTHSNHIPFEQFKDLRQTPKYVICPPILKTVNILTHILINA